MDLQAGRLVEMEGGGGGGRENNKGGTNREGTIGGGGAAPLGLGGTGSFSIGARGRAPDALQDSISKQSFVL